jgi:hypothetical protein
MLVRLFRGRQSLLLENLALRQQLVMLKRRHPRPSLGLVDTWAAALRIRQVHLLRGYIASLQQTLSKGCGMATQQIR